VPEPVVGTGRPNVGWWRAHTFGVLYQHTLSRVGSRLGTAQEPPRTLAEGTCI